MAYASQHFGAAPPDASPFPPQQPPFPYAQQPQQPPQQPSASYGQSSFQPPPLTAGPPPPSSQNYPPPPLRGQILHQPQQPPFPSPSSFGQPAAPFGLPSTAYDRSPQRSLNNSNVSVPGQPYMSAHHGQQPIPTQIPPNTQPSTVPNFGPPRTSPTHFSQPPSAAAPFGPYSSTASGPSSCLGSYASNFSGNDQYSHGAQMLSAPSSAPYPPQRSLTASPAKATDFFDSFTNMLPASSEPDEPVAASFFASSNAPVSRIAATFTQNSVQLNETQPMPVQVANVPSASTLFSSNVSQSSLLPNMPSFEPSPAQEESHETTTMFVATASIPDSNTSVEGNGPFASDMGVVPVSSSNSIPHNVETRQPYLEREQPPSPDVASQFSQQQLPDVVPHREDPFVTSHVGFNNDQSDIMTEGPPVDEPRIPQPLGHADVMSGTSTAACPIISDSPDSSSLLQTLQTQNADMTYSQATPGEPFPSDPDGAHYVPQMSAPMDSVAANFSAPQPQSDAFEQCAISAQQQHHMPPPVFDISQSNRADDASESPATSIPTRADTGQKGYAPQLETDITSSESNAQSFDWNDSRATPVVTGQVLTGTTTTQTAFEDVTLLPAVAFQTASYGKVSPQPIVATAYRDGAGRRESMLSRPPICVVSFGFGGKIVTAIPSKSHAMPCAPVVIRDLPEVLEGTEVLREMQCFPGPLTRDVPKQAVMEYLQQKAKEYYPDSLLWDLLMLIVKHDGISFGGGQVAVDKSTQEIVELLLDSDEGNFTNNVTTGKTGTMKHPPTASERQHTLAAVNTLLLRGKRSEAVQTALDGRLWEYALALSIQIDLSAVHRTLSNIARSDLSPSHPLRVLLLQFCDETEDIDVSEWRDALAMLLSNRTATSAAAICRLGDALSAHGQRELAHFCYLVAGEQPRPLHATSPLVLVGADHNACMRKFVSSIAVQRTEVLEYAMSQGSAQFSLSGLQPFKLIYAMRLADMGLLHEAFNYCNAISAAVKNSSGPGAGSVYTRGFLERLQMLHERLQAHDPSASTAGGNKWWGKVVGGLERTITAFVAGSDDNYAHVHSNANETALPAPSNPPMYFSPASVPQYPGSCKSPTHSSTDDSAPPPMYSTPPAEYTPPVRGSIELNPYQQQQQWAQPTPSNVGYTPPVRGDIDLNYAQDSAGVTTSYTSAVQEPHLPTVGGYNAPLRGSIDSSGSQNTTSATGYAPPVRGDIDISLLQQPPSQEPQTIAPGYSPPVRGDINVNALKHAPPPMTGYSPPVRGSIDRNDHPYQPTSASAGYAPPTRGSIDLNSFQGDHQLPSNPYSATTYAGNNTPHPANFGGEHLAPPPATSAPSSEQTNSEGGGWLSSFKSWLPLPAREEDDPWKQNNTIVWDPVAKAWVDTQAGHAPIVEPPAQEPQAPPPPPPTDAMLGAYPAPRAMAPATSAAAPPPFLTAPPSSSTAPPQMFANPSAQPNMPPAFPSMQPMGTDGAQGPKKTRGGRSRYVDPFSQGQ